jgi:DNA polymerase-2
MDVYKKLSTKNPPSFSLDNVAKFEGLDGKTEKKGFLNFEINFQKFVGYIYKDVELLVRMENQMNLLQIMFGLQSLVKIPLKFVMN